VKIIMKISAKIVKIICGNINKPNEIIMNQSKCVKMLMNENERNNQKNNNNNINEISK